MRCVGLTKKKTICCFNKFWSEGIFVAFLGEDLFRLLPEGSIELVCQFIPLTMGKEFQRQYVFDYSQTIFNKNHPGRTPGWSLFQSLILCIYLKLS